MKIVDVLSKLRSVSSRRNSTSAIDNFCRVAAKEGRAGTRISLKHNAATFVDEPITCHIGNNATIQQALVDVKDVVDISLRKTKLRFLDQSPHLVVEFR